MTTPPEPKPEPDSSAPLTARVDSLETEQKRQGGVLDQIWDKLSGSPDGDTSVTEGTDPPADMAEQMRQAVRDVQAEADAEAGRSARLGRRPESETTPREVMVRGKERLQRALFGGDPK